MNANWSGLTGPPAGDGGGIGEALKEAVRTATKAGLNDIIAQFNELGADSVVAVASAGPGIVGAKRAEHFKVPFALPEEFTAVYRLHSMLPDYLPVYDAKALAAKRLRRFSASELQAMAPSLPLAEGQPLIPTIAT